MKEIHTGQDNLFKAIPSEKGTFEFKLNNE